VGRPTSASRSRLDLRARNASGLGFFLHSNRRSPSARRCYARQVLQHALGHLRVYRSDPINYRLFIHNRSLDGGVEVGY